jgi:hypothetical protein
VEYSSEPSPRVSSQVSRASQRPSSVVCVPVLVSAFSTAQCEWCPPPCLPLELLVARYPRHAHCTPQYRPSWPVMSRVPDPPDGLFSNRVLTFKHTSAPLTVVPKGASLGRKKKKDSIPTNQDVVILRIQKIERKELKGETQEVNE